MLSLTSSCLPTPCFPPSTLSHDLCSSPWLTVLAPPLPLTVPLSHGFPIILSALITQFTWPLPNNDLAPKRLLITAHRSPLMVPKHSPAISPTVSAQTFPRAIPTSWLVLPLSLLIFSHCSDAVTFLKPLATSHGLSRSCHSPCHSAAHHRGCREALPYRTM